MMCPFSCFRTATGRRCGAARCYAAQSLLRAFQADHVSVLSPSKPTRDRVLVLATSLADSPLQSPLLTRNHPEIHHDHKEQESDQDRDATVHKRPAEPERQFSNIHRVSCE